MRGSVGAVRGECDGLETASGWPHGAAVSDGEARERVPVRFDVVAIEEFSSQAPVVRLHRMLLTRGCKKAHWKIRRNQRNAVI